MTYYNLNLAEFPWFIVVLFALFIVIPRIVSRPRLPKRGLPVPSIELEVPNNYKIKATVNGKNILSFPLAQEDKLKIQAREGMIDPDSNIISLREKTHETDIVIALNHISLLDDDHLSIDFEYEAAPDQSTVLSKEAEISFMISYIEQKDIVKIFKVSEKEFRIKGSGSKTIEFPNLYKISKKFIRINEPKRAR